MSKINTQAVADAKKVLTGKDGAFYNSKGKLLATTETYQSKVNVTNTKYQPVGDSQEHEIFTSYGQTLVFTEVVVEDSEFITDMIEGMENGEMPSWNFQGVIRGRNGSEERLVYNDCVPSGDIDLQNVSVGDLIKRQWNMFVNGSIKQQGKLKA
jgi:translation elongation factor P/translation initiation factor 5A